MDQRVTFANSDELFSFVSELFQQGKHASMLIDREGLTRAEGKITAITPNTNVDETLVTVNDIDSFAIKEIMAVNGTFRSEYSEC